MVIYFSIYLGMTITNVKTDHEFFPENQKLGRRTIGHFDQSVLDFSDPLKRVSLRITSEA